MKNSRTVAALFGLNLIDVVIGSLLYSFVADFVGNVEHKGVWISSLFIIYKFCQIVSAPILGSVTDSLGRKPVLVFAAVTTFFAQFCLFSRNLPGIIGNRFSDGLTNGFYQNTKAMLLDILPKDRAPKYLGYLESVTSLGVIIGPALMAFILFALRGSGVDTLSVVVGTGVVLSIINIFVALSIVESRKFEAKKIQFSNVWQVVKKELNIVLMLGEIIQIKKSNKDLFHLVMLNCLVYGAASFYPYMVIYLSQGSLNLNSETINLIVLYSGAAGLVANTVFFKYLYDRIKIQKFILVSLFSEVMVMLFFAFGNLSVVHILTLITLDSLTFGLIFGLISGLVSEEIKQNESGRIFGLLQGASGVVTLVSMLSFSVLSTISINLPFLYFALCIVGALWVALRYFTLKHSVPPRAIL